LVAAAEALAENPHAVLHETDLFSNQLVKAILAFEGIGPKTGLFSGLKAMFSRLKKDLQEN